MSAKTKEPDPKILVFSSNAISDPGIDLAGSAHMHYSTAVQVIPLPCSSGVKPDWVVHALEAGFEGVFIAACGGDCAYLSDCTERTSALIKSAQDKLKERDISPKRLKMSGLCSVCADNFVSHMGKFQGELKKLEAK
ncbi:MAG: hydrogenase iron-sulfur subunit [Verrucomicrobia bacterium]|nr:hydrogenase iron-sulfur subunit [Verrucomicrobiota bacterium]MBT7066394.1 hydrogenase iron-sulfur subunit [Verrucomicrobiota bacterium]MBT7701542.1 hydrogenase iron-sulfur subunit [Verrucomicrobiota bacterium]